MQTKGQYLVGAYSVPTDSLMDQINQKAAELIDLIEEHAAMSAVSTTAQAEQQAQIARCKATAITNIEQGAMWAVKAITKPERV